MKNNSHFKTINKVTFASLLVAIGIIYGDIGTSPLYALRAIIGKREITEMLVYGGVSCVFWTLMFQTTIKYVWIALKADNQGEGGIFSLYALIKRFGKKRFAILAILGATTLLADGIITPPISVSSAIEGLNMLSHFQNFIVPGNSLTIGIIIFILSSLFLFQRFGTDVIGKTFGPIMTIWFLMLLITGLVQISHHPDILKSINPYYAYNLLSNYPQGFWLLGAVFLCTTGAEALYSDLGHTNIKNIRISWVFVKISLIASYLGQAAWLMHQGGLSLNDRNPFFEIMPSWFLLPSIIIATLATIIASQALISGSYTLINEAINLNFWPRVTVRQPTEKKGQIYVPSVNIILWIGCILMVLYFKKSEHMEAAYGFSITITMLMTTLLLCIFLMYILKWKKIYVYIFLFVFACIEGSFFIANVAKIKERWMFLFFELFIFITMYIWYFARKLTNKYTKFVDLDKHCNLIVELSNDETIPTFATHLIYLSKANKKNQIEEKIIKSIFAKKPKRAEVYWFLHINRTESPYTLSYNIIELVNDKVIKLNLNIGFRVQPRTELYFKKVLQELVTNKEMNLHNRPNGSTKYNAEPDFKFVVIERFLSVENELSIKNKILLKAYFHLKEFGTSDEKAFGLDKSDVIEEQVALVYEPIESVDLVREIKK